MQRFRDLLPFWLPLLPFLARVIFWLTFCHPVFLIRCNICALGRVCSSPLYKDKCGYKGPPLTANQISERNSI
ncbi:hypothetical protein SRHO_G00045410 [Serrasalmus rhombeus]